MLSQLKLFRANPKSPAPMQVPYAMVMHLRALSQCGKSPVDHSIAHHVLRIFVSAVEKPRTPCSLHSPSQVFVTQSSFVLLRSDLPRLQVPCADVKLEFLDSHAALDGVLSLKKWGCERIVTKRREVVVHLLCCLLPLACRVPRVSDQKTVSFL